MASRSSSVLCLAGHTVKVKFCKPHKGSLRGIAHGRSQEICFGKYALQALQPSRITSKQVEAGRRAIAHTLQRSGKVWVRVVPDKPVTAKAAETRMGSGKGAPQYFAAYVKPGKVLYEMGGVTENIAREAIARAAAKMPIRTRFISYS